MRRVLKFFGKTPNQADATRNEDEQRISLKKEIKLHKLIGHGSFNFVCTNDNSPSGFRLLAVKLYEDVDSSDEIRILRQVGANNRYVLGVVDIVHSNELSNCAIQGALILSELCSNGTLYDYLRQLNLFKGSTPDELNLNIGDHSIPKVLLTESARHYESVKFSLEITSGMEYLSSRKIIYGKLSTHRVLLDDRKVCKISDFSSSRIISEQEVIGTKLEVLGCQSSWQWLAPECFEGQLGTTCSDVWSTGVTIWEIFSMGDTPYGDRKWGKEFQDGVRNGSIRLPVPRFADKEIYSMMASCWRTKVKLRPKFPILKEAFLRRYLQAEEMLGAQQLADTAMTRPTQVMIQLPAKDIENHQGFGDVQVMDSTNFGPPEVFKMFYHLEAKRNTIFPPVVPNGTIPPPNWSEEDKVPKRIELGALIGYGTFNYVFIGYLLRHEANQVRKPVAVRIPREDSHVQVDLANEVGILRKIGHHQFVLGIVDTVSSEEIIGCSFSGTFMLTELCVNGSLKNYLGRLKASNLEDSYRLLVEEPVRIFESLKFAYQIASGMEYISSKNIAHRDLSARNVLLDEKKNCKISDFGLSNLIGLHKRVEATDVVGIPWRWIAPECFNSIGCSTSSDVWSYGVTIWEIFCTGGCPYGDMEWDREFQQGITSGLIRLPRPGLARENIWELMTWCWQTEITLRPTFLNITHLLQSEYCKKLKELGNEKVGEIENTQPTRLAFEMSSVLGSSPPTLKHKSSIVDFEVPKREWKLDFKDSFGRKVGATGMVRGQRVYIKGERVESGSRTPQAMKGMLNEISIYCIIGSHPNILELVGVSTLQICEGTFYFATQFCEMGNLRDYLVMCREQGQGLALELESERRKILARFAFQIASALAYLDEKGVIHNATQARNALLDSDLTCKLANFRFSRVVDDTGIYCPAKLPRLKWQWVAPEAFTFRKFSVKSDIWGFGVLLYEIYSLGREPFGEIPCEKKFVYSIRQGLLRINHPEMAPYPVYEKILECCNLDPASRPDFALLASFFQGLTRDEYYLKL